MGSFYDDASWLLIPSGIEEDVVYAQKPTSGLGDLTFTRSSDATYTDAGGVVRRSPYNLLQQSNTFNVTWGAAFATVTIGQSGYDGTNNAWLFSKSLADGRISQNITLTSGAYTYSVYAKAGTKNWIFLRIDGTSNRTAYFNLQTGVTGTATGCTSSISSVGNGWYRCSITFTDSTTIARVYVADANNDTSGTSGNILIQAAQLVEGTSALDYFPTTDRQNVPRIDFRNADGTLSSCGRLLLEPQRTNFVLRSEEFDSATWTKSLTTVVANAEISPDGTQDAETMTVSTSVSFVEQAVALTAGTYTFSVYVKVISQTTAGQMRLQAVVDGVGLSVNFTPTTQWQRFTSTYTPTATLTNVRVRGQTFVGTVAVWGAQLETGAYPTTYIPTTTAAVTRLADAASKTGVSSLIGQTEGTLFVDIIPTDVTITNAIGINNGSTNDRVIIFTGSNLIFAQVRVGGVTQFSVTTSATVGVRYKGAIAYKGNDFAFYLNGAQIAVSNTGTVPACSIISYDGGGGISPFLGRNNQAALFPTRLTNAQLAELTTL